MIDLTYSEMQLALERAIESYEHGYYNDAVAELKPLIEAGRSSGGLNPHLLEFLSVIYRTQGKYTEAENLYDEAALILNKFDPLETVDSHVLLLNTKAGLYHIWGQYDKAAELYQIALKSLQEDSTDDSSLTALIHVTANLSDIRIRQGRLAEASDLIFKARKLNQERAESENNPQDDILLEQNLAVLLLAEGRTAEALALLNQILENISSSDPNVPLILKNMALANSKLGRAEEAEAIYRRALAIQECMLDTNHPSIADTYNHLALLFVCQGRFEEAENLCKRALSILGQSIGLDHYFAADVFLNLVSARAGQGLFESIEALQEWAISNVEKTFGAGSWLRGQIYHRIAINYHQRRQYKEAEIFYRKTLELSEDLSAQNRHLLFVTTVNLSHCCFQMCKHELSAKLSLEATSMLLELSNSMLDHSMIDVLETLADLRYTYMDFSTAHTIYERAAALIRQNLQSQSEKVSNSHDKSVLLLPSEKLQFSEESRAPQALRSVDTNANVPSAIETYNRVK